MKNKANKRMPSPNRNSFITPFVHLCFFLINVAIGCLWMKLYTAGTIDTFLFTQTDKDVGMGL